MILIQYVHILIDKRLGLGVEPTQVNAIPGLIETVYCTQEIFEYPIGTHFHIPTLIFFYIYTNLYITIICVTGQNASLVPIYIALFFSKIQSPEPVLPA